MGSSARTSPRFQTRPAALHRASFRKAVENSAMARRRQRWTLAALLLHPASGFYALSRHNARTVLRSSSSDPAENDDTPVPVQKALAAMTAFSNRYVKVSGTKYCSEPSVPAVVIRGLGRTQGSLGRAALPLPQLRRQGGGSEERLLELPLRAHARAGVEIKRHRADAEWRQSRVDGVEARRHRAAVTGTTSRRFPET